MSTVFNKRVLMVAALTLITTGAARGDIVGLWRFNADVSPQPDGSLGNNNHATPVGATWVFDATRTSGAVSLNGLDQYLEAADSPSLSITGDMTIAAWINVTDYANFRSIVGKTNVNLPAPYDYYLVTGSGIPRFFRGDGLGTHLNIDGVVAPATGQWQHVAVTMSGTNVTHYLNGVPNGGGVLSTVIVDQNNPFRIGNRNDLFTDFVGRMDDVAIFDEGLSQAQIGDIMSGNFSAFVIPEPSSIVLAGLGMLAACGYGWRRRRRTR